MIPYFDCQDVTLYQGDAIATLERLETPIHACITSPPYYAKFDYEKDGQYGLEASLEAYLATQVQVFRQVHRLMLNGGSLFVVIGDTQNNYSPIRSKRQRKGKNGEWYSRRKLESGYFEKEPLCVPECLKNALRVDGWRHRGTYIWDKDGGSVVGNSDGAPECHESILHMVKWSGNDRLYGNTTGLKSSILRHKPSSHPEHGCSFPLSLAAELMASLPAGCTVIDPFVGTGTTMIAARDSGRKAIGVDLDCSIAALRCGQLNLLEAYESNHFTSTMGLRDRAPGQAHRKS